MTEPLSAARIAEIEAMLTTPIEGAAVMVPKLRAAIRDLLAERVMVVAEAERYQAVAAEQGSKLLRARVALMLARDWCIGHGWSSEVAWMLADWIYRDEFGPLPWPRSPFVREWLEERGLSEVEGQIGYRVTAQLPEPPA